MRKIAISIVAIFLCFSFLNSQEKIRHSAVAGSWYPGDSHELRKAIENFLEKGSEIAGNKSLENGKVFGIVAPHAGYYYSGAAAGAAYSQIENTKFDVVVIIAPSHREAFRGSSVYPGDAYETPLGKVVVNREIAGKIVNYGQTVRFSEKGHLLMGIPQEHSLEIQLPFLQVVLEDFTLVPIIMGEQNYTTCDDLAQSIVRAVEGEKCLIVASSDLSHFHKYEDAVKMDSRLLNAVENFDYNKLIRNIETREWEACGGGPIGAMMMACEKLGAKNARLLTYYNSGDIPGTDKSSVVGYAGGVLYKDE